MRRSKRYTQGIQLLDKGAMHSVDDAMGVVQSFPKARFDETVEVSFNLGVDAKKSDQMVRGTVTLPNGTGRTLKIVVITRNEDKAKSALEAGATVAGYQELIERISGGWLDFDLLIASPDVMRDLGKLGRILGPKGLMPSPKAGTVAEDVVGALEEVKKGKIEFKMDRHSNVHIPIGKMSFTKEMLIGNCQAVVAALLKAKPAAAKGQFVKSATLTSTMGPGVKIDLKEIIASGK